MAILSAVLLVLCTALPAMAEGEPTITFADWHGDYQLCTYTLPNGGTMYFGADLDDNGEIVSDWTLYESENLKGDIVIPEYIEGKPVSRLYYENFPDAGGTHVFCLNGNPEMISVVFPATLQEIEGVYLTGAWFGGCSKLEQIIFQGDGPEEIPPYFFRGAPELKRVKLPRNIAKLDGTFVSVSYYDRNTAACTSIASLELDSGNKNFVMDEQGILYNHDKTKVVTAIQGAAERKTVTLPETVTEIADYAFAGNTQLETVYGGAARVVENGYGYTFYKCNSLNPFQDTYGHWAEEQVKWAYQAGFLKGTELLRFSPNAALERGMICTVLHRLENSPPAGSDNPFPDVIDYAWYGKGVIWAAKNGLVMGHEDGLFRPTDPVTREQLAAVLYRYAQFKGIAGTMGKLDSFTDAGKTSAYAVPAMEWAVGSGLLRGRDDGTLDPQGYATRAEAAVILQRLQTLA
ncbi:S-layer homology domain-containing protein [Acutalibacter sp. JLR.KK004]|uniref:S-layer homology domain-containing protein n=1 Tax=Acutalibacter sp. JLR.KK004 TaxID=3112622 RepID=UPI002FF340D6